MGTQPPPGKCLTSWKEIASFFGRDIRTVQRWEKEESLPVHRHLHQRRSSIYAYPEELQDWWEKRGAQVAHRAATNGVGQPRPWLRWAVPVGALGLAGVLLATWVAMRATRGHALVAAPLPLPTLTLEGTKPQSTLLADVSGDINGDGLPDSVFSSGLEGDIYILFGGAGPLAANSTFGGTAELTTVAGVTIHNPNRSYLSARQIGDFDGDGIADLLVSESLTEPEYLQNTGKSYLLWGRQNWPKTLSLPKDADVTLWMDRAGYTSQLGGCLQGTGAPADLNRDGLEDVVLSAPEYGHDGLRSNGVVFIFFGRKAWPRELEVQARADVTLHGSRTGEALGSVCAVGDLTGDNLPELAVQAHEGALWNLLQSRGRTYVFAGRTAWPNILRAEEDALFYVPGARPYDLAASVVLADCNGDGHADLILGRPGLHSSYLPPGETARPGELHIWFGGIPRKKVAEGTAEVVVTGLTPGARFGEAVTAADLDGDGASEVMVSEPGRGEIYFFYGRKEWKKSGGIADFEGQALFRGEPETGVSRLVPTLLDPSGVPALLFSAPQAATKAGPQTGRAWIVKPDSPLRIDVRPEREPNYLYRPQGLVVVRVFGDTHTRSDPIDPATVRLAGAAPERHLLKDFDSDGIADLDLHFETGSLSIAPDATRITLTARTHAGRLLAGSDVITIIPPGRGQPAPASN